MFRIKEHRLKIKLIHLFKKVIFLINVFLLTIGTLFLGNYELIMASTGSRTASFAQGTNVDSHYFCRGYYFTPTHDVIVNQIYGHIRTNALSVVGIWELNSNNKGQTSYLIEQKVVYKEFSTTNRHFMPVDNVILEAGKGYLIAQSIKSGTAQVHRALTVFNNDIPFIDMLVNDGHSLRTNFYCTEATMKKGIVVNAITPGGTNRLDIGFTFFVNSINFLNNDETGSTSASAIIPFIGYVSGTAIQTTSLSNPLYQITRAGYSFEGWASGGAILTELPSTMPEGIIDLVAQWNPHSYSLEFNGNGASSGSLNTQFLSFDQPANLNPNPFTKVGHTFSGWNTQADGQGDSFNADASVSNLSVTSGANIDLYAQWTINNYTLNFVSNGGNNVPSITRDFNQALDLTIPLRAGYDFIGWYLDVALESSFDAETMPAINTSSVTLYAKWQLTQFDITYNNIEDAVNTNPSTYDEATSINLTAPQRDGFTFLGWFDESNFSGTPREIIDAGTTPLTLYAKWQINAYTLSFNSNGGSAFSDLTADYQSSIELPNPTRLGFRFDGWTENANSVNFTSMPLGNRTLTATWTPLIYTLTLINSMTNEQTTITTNFGLPIQLPQINQPGYTFGGWLENNRPVRFTTMPSGNRTLVASFNARSYLISFSSEKGSAPAPIQGAYQATIQLPVMNVDHFIFKGWQGPSGIIQGSFQVPLNGASFIAVFEPKLYTISFVAEGVEVPNLEVPFDTPMTLPIPSKAGYRFTGWTLNGTPYIQTQMPGENLTLTATFEKVELILRLVSEGRTIRETTLNLDDSFTLPTAQKRGYTFDGWYEGNTRIRDGVMPARNLTLEARFLINSYPVTFVDFDSAVTERFVYESSVPLPFKERLGYRFIGWARNGQIIDQLIMTDAVIELSAVYQPLMASMTFITPLQQIEASITTNQPLTNLNALNVPEGYTWIGYFSSPFGVGESIQSGRMIDNAHDTMLYPYYLRAGQTFDSSIGRLSTDPYYFGNLETPVLSSNAFSWFETITFITTSLALIGLYVISKGAKWDEKIH